MQLLQLRKENKVVQVRLLTQYTVYLSISFIYYLEMKFESVLNHSLSNNTDFLLVFATY